MTVRTPVGRKLRPVMLHMAPPLVRVKPKDLIAAGVERVPRVVGVQDGRPLLEDGRVVEDGSHQQLLAGGGTYARYHHHHLAGRAS
jgi:hypothetical protein